MTFEKELQSLINKYSKENESNTPDFILAEYLSKCLKTFNEIMFKREKWYGRLDQPVFSKIEMISGSLTSPEFKTQINKNNISYNNTDNTDIVTKNLFKRTLQQFYTNTKVKTNAEKIKALK